MLGSVLEGVFGLSREVNSTRLENGSKNCVAHHEWYTGQCKRFIVTAGYMAHQQGCKARQSGKLVPVYSSLDGIMIIKERCRSPQK